MKITEEDNYIQIEISEEEQLNNKSIVSGYDLFVEAKSANKELKRLNLKYMYIPLSGNQFLYNNEKQYYYLNKSRDNIDHIKTLLDTRQCRIKAE